MTSHHSVPPPLVSVPRITTLVASLFVALGSGTNYIYLAYSPQLGSRLGISHTKLNIVALAGNVGVYLSGPIWGRIVDSRGPKILLACGFTFLLAGYLGMRYLFDAGLPEGVKHLSTPSFLLLSTFSFLTGAGGNGGLTSSVNSTAKTFPDKARASTTGLVISGFGLSAFFFSTIAHLAFPGNTSDFFLVLALGTSIPMVMGFFLVRPIPLPPQDGFDIVHNGLEDEDEALTTALLQPNGSHSHLLDHDFIESRHPHYVHHEEAHQEELDDRRSPTRRQRSLSRGTALELGVLPNLHGRRLVKSVDFWILFTILSILSGTGLMYINNVGSMSRTLYAFHNKKYDDAAAATWQATQVSTISVTNFLGRIFIGLVSDFTKSRYDMPRSYCLVLVASLFFVSQFVLTEVADINHLWLASSILGLAYGSVFSLMPTVCLEWFGMPHFSENWGFLSMSPIIAGNLFSLIFGRNFDKNEHAAQKPKASLSTRLRREEGGPPHCLRGQECYVDTVYLTLLASFLTILLTVYAGYRDRRKILAMGGRRPGSASSRIINEEERNFI
ncbi:major facilitator superfamily domain-containing protein [Crepidotus variabilis]|uniref:Major facilitator superfamily domain-containing protein n=1 Tax=Crepidotus variabilis TaxID=179855 RepID=A0A9P6EKS2_9AGAR|nr:major facilitator superfamily domain-containing protein [Crepidotus variabilis]